MPGGPRLTTTSYAVLGLLALREWTTYELAQQMQRSFGHFWARAERRIYDEPKRLARAGYAVSRSELTGHRKRTCWQITPQGRTALHGWLDETPEPGVSLEFEGMVKVFLADNGTKAQLLASLRSIREGAEAELRNLTQLCADVADTGGGQFSSRLHINALSMSYALSIAELTASWAADAEESVRSWRSTAAPGTRIRTEAMSFFTHAPSRIPTHRTPPASSPVPSTD